MKSDKYIQETYIKFVAGPMNDLAKLFARSEILIRNISVFNKKKTANILQEEYRAFQRKVCTAWESIYSSSSQYAESAKQFELLQNKKSIYAITMYQKLSEQFFHRLHLASRLILSDLDDKKLSRKTDLSPFSSLNFSGVDLIMKDIFPLILEEMKKQEFNVENNTKKAFVEANRIFLRNSSIKYHYGDELTEARINQILSDMKEHDRKEKAKWDEGISNGTVRVNIPMYRSSDEVDEGLESASASLLADAIYGSDVIYGSLPIIHEIKAEDLSRILMRMP